MTTIEKILSKLFKQNVFLAETPFRAYLKAQLSLKPFPPEVTDKEFAIKKIEEYLPRESMSHYLRVIGRDNFSYPELTDLLIAGQHLLNLERTQSKAVIKQLKAKFKSIKIVQNAFSDLLAEVKVAEAISQLGYEIELEKLTGKKTKNGLKNSDVYIPILDLYVEVKNFNESKTKYFVKLRENIKNGTKKLPSVAAVPNLSGNIRDLISNAKSKFLDGQSAILFIIGLDKFSTGLQAVFRQFKAPDSPVKAIVAVGRMGLDEYEQKVKTFVLRRDKKVESFLQKLHKSNS